MIRTFVDSGVLIAAARGDQAESEPALRMLEDPGRQLLTSVFVRLEVYPKTAFHAYPLQRAFLNEFFMDPLVEWAGDLNKVVNLAISLSERHGFVAMDALHLAAARLLEADEFVTTEKPGRADDKRLRQFQRCYRGMFRHGREIVQKFIKSLAPFEIVQ